jgi:hypothetical protein
MSNKDQQMICKATEDRSNQKLKSKSKYSKISSKINNNLTKLNNNLETNLSIQK